MEEDKKRLENLIKEFKTYGDLDGIQDLSTYVQSIENLIKEYQNSIEIEQEHRKENGELRERVTELEKELNEENKRCMLLASDKQDLIEMYRREHEFNNERALYVMNNFTQNSKIKDKIEELHNKYIKILNDYGNTSTDIIINVVSKEARKDLDEIVNQIQILQELLERRK